jgi:hypothetical protein
MSEQQLLQRIEDLEGRLAALEVPKYPWKQDLEGLEKEFSKTVLRCSTLALDRWFREIPFDKRMEILYGLPRPVLLKVREALSARSWDELLNAWKQGEVRGYKKSALEEALVTFAQLSEMGMISVEDSDGPVNIGQTTGGDPTPVSYWDQYRIENHQRLDKATKEAQGWLSRELPE